MPDESASLREASEAWEALFRCQVTIMRRLQKHPAFKGLNMREYDVLFNLSRCPSGGLRLGDLNEHVLMSQPSLSRMVERLESKGLVERRPDPCDQRAVRLTLTDRGRELQRGIGREHVRHIHELLSPALSPEQLRELTALTTRLGEAVGSS
ncbi:MAG: MarR family transcriptional regulator [Arthrobacter sp.]|uniref:MarR family winged helix-turn-helix transcriptional regulator n=1 Tax=Arthrobacter sp. TaxID=1667 RepID=UPI00347DB1B0